jgi:GT2 family glycosyltransferase
VSIIIPTAGQIRDVATGKLDLLATCVESIIARTEYHNYEVLCVDNGDLSDATRQSLESLQDQRIKLLSFTRPFNLADKMNFGAQHASGPHLLFLNDDTSVLSGEWLAAMLEFSQQDEIGAVGAKLYFPDNRVQHAGVIIPNYTPFHVFYRHRGTSIGYFSNMVLTTNYSAVTGACMMTRAEVFNRAGGFNLVFPINYNDVDYCLKVRELGYRIVFTPFAGLCHFESLTRVGGVRVEETARLKDVWGETIQCDPYYNPNFNPYRDDFSL